MKLIMADYFRQLILILKKNRGDDEGQSTIEFLFSFFFILGFIFGFLKISLNAAEGYMVHYATYMASRTYLVAQQNTNRMNNSTQAFRDSKTTYESIFKVGLDKLSNNEPTETNTNLFVGLHTLFERKFTLGLIGAGRKMKLISESYLGREPTKEECRVRICDAMQVSSSNRVKCGTHTTLFDNGC